MDDGRLIQVEASLPKGMARLAAAAPQLDDRKEAAYFELPARSLLTRCRSRRVPFVWTINPYRGCAFACVYCYARYTHEYFLEDYANRLRDRSYRSVPETILDFERRIYAKTGAAEVLAEELRRRDLRGQHVALGTATDPYQPAERRYRLTRSLLEVLARHRGMVLSITTKGDLIVRDLPLLQRLAANHRLHVNMTVTTLDHALAHRLEPRAPRPDRRLGALRQLVEGGIHAGVFVMPLLPGLTDGAEDLDRLLAAVKQAGARYVAAQPLFLRDAARARFYPWLREEFPDLFERYRRIYERDADLNQAEAARVMETFHALRRRHGLPAGREARHVPPAGDPDQPALAF